MKILLLEDNLERISWFRQFFVKDELCISSEPKYTIEFLKDHDDFDKIYLDHDLLPEHYRQDCTSEVTTGLAVANWLSDNPRNNYNAEIIIHSRNWAGVGRMASALVYGNRKVLLYPFSIMSGLNI